MKLLSLCIDKIVASGLNTLLVMMALLLSACDQAQQINVNKDIENSIGNDIGNDIKELTLLIESPTGIENTNALSRVYNPDNLILEVSLNNQLMSTVQLADGNYQVVGTVDTPSFGLEISWTERFNETPDAITIASYKNQINLAETDVVIIKQTDYESDSFDQDRDGDSNLFELINDTNIFNSNECSTCSAIVDSRIHRISPDEAPTIDGVYDEIWNQAQFKDQEGDLDIVDLIGRSAGNPVVSATYGSEKPPFRIATMHDGSYLYVLLFGDISPNHTTNSNDSVDLLLELAELKGKYINYTFQYDDGQSTQAKSALGIHDSNDLPELSLQNPTVELGGAIASMGVCPCTSEIGSQALWEFRLPFNTSFLDIEIDKPIRLLVFVRDYISSTEYFWWANERGSIVVPVP